MIDCPFFRPINDNFVSVFKSLFVFRTTLRSFLFEFAVVSKLGKKNGSHINNNNNKY